jgi:hypothetical protein
MIEGHGIGRGNVEPKTEIYEVDDTIGGTGLLIYDQDDALPRLLTPIRDAEILFASPLGAGRILLVCKGFVGMERSFVSIIDAASGAIIQKSSLAGWSADKYLITRNKKHLLGFNRWSIFQCNILNLDLFLHLSLIELIDGQWYIGNWSKYFDGSKRVYHSKYIEDECAAKLGNGQLFSLDIDQIISCGETEGGKISFAYNQSIYTTNSDGSRSKAGEKKYICYFLPETHSCTRSEVSDIYSTYLIEPWKTDHICYRDADVRFSNQAIEAATVNIQVNALDASGYAAALDRLAEIILQGIDKVRFAHTLKFRFHCNDKGLSRIYGEQEFADLLWGAKYWDSSKGSSDRLLQEGALVIAPSLERLITAFLDSQPDGEQLYHNGDDGIAVCDPFVGALLILNPERLDLVRRYISSLDLEHCVLEGLTSFGHWATLWAHTPKHVHAAIYCWKILSYPVCTHPDFIDRAATVISGKEFFELVLTELNDSSLQALNATFEKIKSNSRNQFGSDFSDAIDAWRIENDI